MLSVCESLEDQRKNKLRQDANERPKKAKASTRLPLIENQPSYDEVNDAEDDTYIATPYGLDEDII